jgi:hypothetical protein
MVGAYHRPDFQHFVGSRVNKALKSRLISKKISGGSASIYGRSSPMRETENKAGSNPVPNTSRVDRL